MNLSIEPPKVYLVWDDAFQDYVGLFSSEVRAVQFAKDYNSVCSTKLWLKVWRVDGSLMNKKTRELP